jgi:hypothetical protein
LRHAWIPESGSISGFGSTPKKEGKKEGKKERRKEKNGGEVAFYKESSSSSLKSSFPQI